MTGKYEISSGMCPAAKEDGTKPEGIRKYLPLQHKREKYFRNRLAHDLPGKARDVISSSLRYNHLLYLLSRVLLTNKKNVMGI